ncbi:MAG: YlxR family protein [Anaerolineae bacterium]|nr:YlxR family protein [Anaerolineae bacterium]
MAKQKQPQHHPRHVPQRTCVVCRQKFDKRRLTRIVHTTDAGVVVDPTGKQNGRGAYLCDQPSCWEKASHQPNILAQALKTGIKTEELVALAAYAPTTA